MARTFDGLSDLEWKLFADLFLRSRPSGGVAYRIPPFVRSSTRCSTSCSLAAAGVISPAAPNGSLRVPPIGGGSAGRPMGPSRPCQPVCWGWPKNAG
jgi:hypothetical protein